MRLDLLVIRDRPSSRLSHCTMRWWYIFLVGNGSFVRKSVASQGRSTTMCNTCKQFWFYLMKSTWWTRTFRNRNFLHDSRQLWMVQIETKFITFKSCPASPRASCRFLRTYSAAVVPARRLPFANFRSKATKAASRSRASKWAARCSVGSSARVDDDEEQQEHQGGWQMSLVWPFFTPAARAV